jgi:hypothetical protein
MKTGNTIHKSWFNCLEDCVSTVLEWQSKDYIALFARSWRALSWDEMRTGEYEMQMGDYDVCPNTDNMQFLLNQYYQIDLIEKQFSGRDQLNHYIKECINLDTPVIIGADTFYFPWSQFYHHIHSLHYIIITGMNEDAFVVSDILQNVSDVELEITSMDMMVNTFTLRSKEIVTASWQPFDLFIENRTQIERDVMNQGLEAMKVFAEQGLFDKEKVYQDGIEIEIMPFNRYLLAVSRGRIATAKVLERMKQERFLGIINELTYLGAQWGSLRLQIMKSFLMDDWDDMAAEFSATMTALVEQEMELFNQYMELPIIRSEYMMLQEENKIAIETIKTDISLEAYFNAKGFYQESSNTQEMMGDQVGFDQCGYFYYNSQNKYQKVEKLLDFKLQYDLNYDNISCNRQVILLPENTAVGLRIIGSSERGNFSEKFTIFFADQPREYFLRFSDWMEAEGIFGETVVADFECIKKADRIVGTCFLFENIFTWDLTKKNLSEIKKIVLPQCPNIHIFSIQLLDKLN